MYAPAMIDLTRLRIGDFHDRVAAAVPCVPDDDETRAALRGRRLADVLGVFLNHHGRFVPARPRNVDYAADFWTSQAVRVEADIAALEGRMLIPKVVAPSFRFDVAPLFRD